MRFSIRSEGNGLTLDRGAKSQAENASSRRSRPGLTAWELVFAVVAGLFGAWILLSATSVYGAGVSSDSMFYLSSADNFTRGVGFFDFKGDPLTDFPPLYPLALGALSWASGISSFVWGRFLNAAALGLLIASVGLLVRRCFPNRKLWFYLGALATLLFLPLYTLGANIATDLIYILLSVWFCLAAQSFLESRNLGWLLLMTLLSASGAMLRWVGLALVVCEALLVLAAYRHRIRQAVLYAAAFGGLSFLPLALWVGVRNEYLYGTMGRAGLSSGKVHVLQNLQIAFARIMAWAGPNPAVYCLLPLALLLAAAIVLNRDKGRLGSSIRQLFAPAILPVVILSAVYFFAVTVTAYTADHLQTFDDRYQAPLFFFLLVLLLLILDELILANLKGRSAAVALTIALAIFGVWGYRQAALISGFVQTSKEQGVVEYNDYNNKQMIRSGLVVYMIKNPPPPGMALYSNEPEAIYFFLHRQSKSSPVDPVHYSAAVQDITSLYPHWPAEPQAYLIWFKPNIKRQYYDPGAIEQLTQMEKLYKRYDGEVYIVRAKNQNSGDP
jgi:hypothetical protein